jgi:hypothetical protein
METDSNGEEDDGGAGDTRIASMIVEIHSYVFSVHMTEPDKNNVFVLL